MKRLFSKLNKKKNFDPLGILNNPSPKTGETTDNMIISGRSTLAFADRKISKRNMIIVVVAFALVGSYIVYRSFAETTTTSTCNFAQFPSRLKTSGRNLVDENGCVMPKLKGFNIHAATSAGSSWAWEDSHFRDISANGGRVLRTVVKWDAYESTQGVINEANLSGLDAHIARAQRNGLYVILELHLNTGNVPTWATNGDDEMDKYINHGQKITQTLAQRYSTARSADGLTINPKTVIGFNLNEPPQDNTTISGNNSIPTFESQQRQMISWFRSAGAPDWIGFVSLAYANQKPYLASPKVSANPDAYDAVGGNVVFDAHDYLVYNDSTDPNTDSRQGNGVLADTRYFSPGAHWLSIQDPHSYPTDATKAARAKDQMKAFLKPFDTYASAAQMPLMIGEFGWNQTGNTTKAAYYSAKREAMNSVNPAIEIHWIYGTNLSQDPWSAKPGGIWDPDVLTWLKDSGTTTVTPPPTPTLSLKLINADTDQAIAPLTNGMTIDLKDARNLNIDATSNVAIESVRFDDNAKVVTENSPPYAIGGDAGAGSSDYFAWTPTVGTHTLAVKAFSADNAVGELATTTISFTVKDSSTATTSPPAGSWELVYQDDFNSLNTSSTSPTAWQLYSGPGHGGNGLRQPGAISAANGLLTITAKNIDSDGNGTLDKVSSGGMSNKTNMTYGKYEARVRTDIDPSGIMSGVMLTWPQTGTNWANGENDYYETLHPVNTRTPFKSFIHYPDTAENTYPTPQASFNWNSDASQWHRVVMEWTAAYINIKVYKSPDGSPEVLVGDQTYLESTDPNRNNIPDVPHHATIQLDAFSTALLSQPVLMQVDYIRVYKQSSTTTDSSPTVSINAPSPNTTVSGTSYNTVTAATDDKGIAKVEFYLDGVLKLTQNETAPLPTNKTYNYAFDSFQFANNSQHTFMVKVYDGVNAATTNSTNFIVNNPDTTKPYAPTTLNLALVNNNTDVKLDWSGASDNTGVAGYYVYRHEGDASKAIAIATLSNVTTYTDTTPLPGTTYYYYVIAKDAAGNLSTPSPTNNIQVPAVTDTTAPTTPTNLNATAISSNQINLSWTPSSDNVGVKEYRIYRDNNFVGSHQASLCNATACTWSEAGLTANTVYSYQVEAVDAAGNPSQVKAGPLNITTKPLAITLKLINADTDQVVSAISNGMTIDLKNARNLNIDASASGVVESIQFNDNGEIVNESFTPYAIGGDAGTGSSDYYPWTPTVGSHTLTIKAYSADGATGTELASTTINFTVVDTTLSEVLSVEGESMSVPSDLSAAKILSDTSASGGNLLRFYKNYESSRQVTLNSPITTMKIKAKGFQCGGRSPQMVVKIGNTQLPVTVSSTSWAEYTVSTNLTSGTHTLSIALNNDYSQYSGNSGKIKCSLDLDVDKVTFN